MTQANADKYSAFTNKFAQIIEDSNKIVRNRLAAIQRKKEEVETEN